jgi:hypothetical protein
MTSAPRPDLAAARRRVERLAWWLDGFIGIPGTRLRLGFDALLGLIPGIGDIAGLLLGGGIVAESLRLGAPNRVVARMLSNLAIDALVGVIPLVGDLFDAAHRAHAKNARLLLEHLDTAHAAAPLPMRRRLAMLAAAALVLLLLLALAVLGLTVLLRQLF